MQTNGHRPTVPAEQSPASHRNQRFSLPSGAKPLSGYTIKRGVGIGGFGEVYYATSDAGKEVALKRIQRNLEIELRGVRQCLNLKHQNLVALYDIKYDDDDQAWVVMEFVSGESLQDVIERYPQGMPADELHKWFDGIAAGVAYLHDCGIVHRDLKPGNIFIDDETVKIGDYGLSKFISCSRRSGQTQSVGTFHYMAPEIGQGRYGKEIDVYALGIMLYEMVTGRVPYDGESSQEIIMKHLTAQPDFTGVPSPIREVIAEALAKDPAARSSSVEEMRQRVRAATGSPILAKAVAAGRKVHPVDAAAVAASTMIAAGARVAQPKPLPEEPIAKALRTAWTDIVHGWNSSQLGSTTKLLILLAAIPLVLINARWLLPYGATILVSYGVYVVIRSMVLKDSTQRGQLAAVDRMTNVHDPSGVSKRQAAVEQPVLAEPVHGAVPRRMTRRARRLKENPHVRDQRLLQTALRNKNSRIRWTELTGSMALAAVVCCVISLIGFLVLGASQPELQSTWIPSMTWVAVVATLSAWCVLFAAKWWEGKTDDMIRRRFTMLLLGLGVGFAAWGLGQFMSVRLPYLAEIEGLMLSELNGAPNLMYDGRGTPLLAGHLAFFGGLFLMIRWWRQADPIRTTRLGIWRTMACLIGSLVVQAFFPFPFGFMIPLTMAVAIQIAAPYLDKDQRLAICDHHAAGVQA